MRAKAGDNQQQHPTKEKLKNISADHKQSAKEWANKTFTTKQQKKGVTGSQNGTAEANQAMSSVEMQKGV